MIIDVEGLNEELCGRIMFCLNAILKGNRTEAECGFTAPMMTEKEFGYFWPEEDEDEDEDEE